MGPSYTYRGASGDLQRLVYRVFTSTEIISAPSSCGVNCSYEFSFFGPAYQCNIVDPLPNLTTLSDPNRSWIFSTNYISVRGVYQNKTGIWIGYGTLLENLQGFHCVMYNSTYDTRITYLGNLPKYQTV